MSPLVNPSGYRRLAIPVLTESATMLAWGRVAKLADAVDSKSTGVHSSCRFKSDLGHQEASNQIGPHALDFLAAMATLTSYDLQLTPQCETQATLDHPAIAGRYAQEWGGFGRSLWRMRAQYQEAFPRMAFAVLALRVAYCSFGLSE